MGGKRFGELEKVTGVTFFRLSPYEQSPFAGIRQASGRFLKRCRAEFFFITPPFICSYLLMEWANAEFHKLQRKNPKDYENDT
ncbi:cytochrome b-c1 complex subunit 8 [Bombus pascuorum]|uniref:cytochrome b-c1 complex subunit 8 n=1 Tax=Bombus pascuorum TaxID=65598 RepID=UPI00298E3B48|nr:cytochrome b-c1 complex subunit 8 [Bombus pascuorum]XP_060817153.1 cytochrome b-c1 complex subunit 8 [Bombus pascuorum]